MDNLEEIYKFLEKYNFSKAEPGSNKNLNRPITSMEIKPIIKNLPRNKNMHRNE